MQNAKWKNLIWIDYQTTVSLWACSCCDWDEADDWEWDVLTSVKLLLWLCLLLTPWATKYDVATVIFEASSVSELVVVVVVVLDSECGVDGMF